jgi:hypothetical protein
MGFSFSSGEPWLGGAGAWWALRYISCACDVAVVTQIQNRFDLILI